MCHKIYITEKRKLFPYFANNKLPAIKTTRYIAIQVNKEIQHVIVEKEHWDFLVYYSLNLIYVSLLLIAVCTRNRVTLLEWTIFNYILRNVHNQLFCITNVM